MSATRHAPLIGITCEAVAPRGDFSRYDLVCDHRYAEAVKNAGGHPVLLPLARRRSLLRRYLEGIDGLVIVGGDDVDPRLYGADPAPGVKLIHPHRTDFEAWLYRAGRRRRLPILAICYGMQLVNVLEGGTLHQEIPPRPGPRVRHSKRRAEAQHGVFIEAGSRLHQVLRVPYGIVATEHHQCIDRVAPGLRVAARAEDGVIEAIEMPGRPEILAVQWHPERMLGSRLTRRLFATFVAGCREYRTRREERRQARAAR